MLLAILNERSHGGGRDDIHCLELCEQLVQTLRRAKEFRRLALVTREPLMGIALSPTTTVGVLTQSGRGRELGRFMRNLQQIAPFAEAPRRAGQPEDGLDELQLDGERVEGLALAWRVGGLAVSFATQPRWEATSIPLVHLRLEETDDGDLLERRVDVVVPHVSSPHHVDGIDELQELGRQSISSGSDLWRYRAELFDHLHFLPRVEHQLEELDAAGSSLRIVYDNLRAIDRDVAAWDSEGQPLPEWSKHVVPEHQGRKALCVFPDMDGESRCFDLHIRFPPRPGRIHLRVDRAKRAAHIAHVGRKLGT